MCTTVTLLILGFKVGAARNEYKEKALKEDYEPANCCNLFYLFGYGKKQQEEKITANFSLPKLYAEGFSVNAKKFNCVQRGHQQAMETYPQFVALSLIAGLQFPVSAALAGLFWNYARYASITICLLIT